MTCWYTPTLAQPACHFLSSDSWMLCQLSIPSIVHKTSLLTHGTDACVAIHLALLVAFHFLTYVGLARTIFVHRK
jgi:hypothetical protein